MKILRHLFKPLTRGIMLLIPGILMVSCTAKKAEVPAGKVPPFRLMRMHYENSNGEKGVTHYYYDPEGINYLAVWHLQDSSRSSLNVHLHDSSGRMIEKSRTFSDGIRSVQHFEYDERGRLVREDFRRSDGVTGEVIYSYSPEGRLEAADCRGMNGWFYGKIRYAWEGDRKTGAELMRDSVHIGRIAYRYEGERLVEETWDFNGSWSQAFRYEYAEAARQTCTSPNVFMRESPWFTVNAEYYTFNGKPGGPSFYTYDESGKLLGKEYIRSDGLSTHTTYTYDSTGLLDLSLREYADGRRMEFLYWYSVDRKLLVRTFREADGGSGLEGFPDPDGLAGSEAYRYEDGRLIRGEYDNVDSWLNGTLVFEYDPKGVLTSAVFKGEDGADASLSFAYDRDFNLIKIHWEFTSGHTQTYHYIYKPLRILGDTDY